MDENLVGYLLGSLDEAGKRQVEAYLRANPEAWSRLAAVKKALNPLAADCDDVVPPPGLASRTLAMIAQTAAQELPRAPREAAATAGSRGGMTRATGRWRLPQARPVGRSSFHPRP